MKKLTLTLLALCCALTLAAQSRIETFTVRSSKLGTEKVCTVYLPNGYDESARTYPVLYLLHGASGCHTDWSTKANLRQVVDEAVAAGSACPMIVVMPDASGEGERKNGKNMGYFNVEGWSYEDFFFEEFMPAVEKHYRIRAVKTHRAIAGLSMGGGGSAVYALRHPELFGAACPISGLLDGFPNGRNYEPTFVQSVVDNSPLTMLRQLDTAGIETQRTIRWWIDCGDDDFLYACNIAFYDQMRRLKIPIQYRMRDGGHTWIYWQTALTPILTYLSVGFNAQ